MTDRQLFRRLFEQRNDPSEALYLTAQACSLVYSFQGEDISDGEGAELGRLGKLAGLDVSEVYRHVAESKRRGLAQQRGVWRAILPQAMANPIAEEALQNIPRAMIEQHLVTTAPDRLKRSFSRRIGYLHASAEAVTLVRLLRLLR